jgi:hypothetical protein
MNPQRLFALALLTPSVLSIACAAAPARLPCSADTDCGLDEICREGECAVFFEAPVVVEQDVPPLAARGVVTATSEDVPLTIALETTGGDGSAVSWRSFNETPQVGVFVLVDDVLTFEPAPEASGLAIASVMPIQSGAFGQPAQVLVNVGAIDDGPNLSVMGPFVTQVDTLLSIFVSATDRENEAVTFTASFDNGTGEEAGLDDGVATIQYVPPPGFVGQDEGEVVATDATDASTSVKVIITVE